MKYRSDIYSIEFCNCQTYLPAYNCIYLRINAFIFFVINYCQSFNLALTCNNAMEMTEINLFIMYTGVNDYHRPTCYNSHFLSFLVYCKLQILNFAIMIQVKYSLHVLHISTMLYIKSSRWYGPNNVQMQLLYECKNILKLPRYEVTSYTWKSCHVQAAGMLCNNIFTMIIDKMLMLFCVINIISMQFASRDSSKNTGCVIG